MDHFVKFESLLVHHSPDSWECMGALKRVASNKPVSEKWIFRTLMLGPIIEVKSLQLAPCCLFQLCIVCVNMVL